MKIQINTGIYGIPAKLHLTAKILYGNKEQFETKVFHKEYSLDDGGVVVLDMDFFSKYAKNMLM